MAGGQWLSGPLLPAEYDGFYYRRRPSGDGGEGYLEVIPGVIDDGRSDSGADSYRLTSTMCGADDIDAGLWECETERYVMLVGAPLLLLLGTVGNALTFTVMAKSGHRFGPTSCYLQALAVSDTLTLWIGLGRHFYKRLTWVDIRNVSPAACQLHRFLLYASMDCSAWYLVGLTVDRFVAVCLPLRKGSFTTARARVAICATAACCCLFNVHVFWTRGAQLVTSARLQPHHVVTAPVTAALPSTFAAFEGADGGGFFEVAAAANHNATEAAVSAADNHSMMEAAVSTAAFTVTVDNCGYPNEASRQFWTYTQGWIAMFKYSIIPSLLMLGLNAAIMRKLNSQEKRLSSHSFAPALSAGGSSVGYSDSGGGQQQRHRRQVCKPHGRQSSELEGGGKQVQVRTVPRLTAMLLACTMFFLFVGAPAYVYNSCELVIYQTVNDPRRKGALELIDAAVTLLNYLNHAANFFLYATVGLGFRHEVQKLLLRLLCCHRWRPHNSRSSSLAGGEAATGLRRAVSLKYKGAQPLL